MQDVNIDPWGEIEDMVDAFDSHELDAHVLAASLRTPQDVSKAFALGCHVTAKPSVLDLCIATEHTDNMVKEFNKVRIMGK